jgi:hypothetical protein
MQKADPPLRQVKYKARITAGFVSSQKIAHLGAVQLRPQGCRYRPVTLR